LLSAALATTAIAQQSIDSAIQASANAQLPSLLAIYKDIHEHPELSHHEARTSALYAAALRKDGYEVTEHVGRYKSGKQAYGVVAILKNGPGPTVLLRNELDALPVEEKTGLPYASHVHELNDEGQEVPVDHACGHDMHIAAMLGAARALAAMKSQWRGTVMIVGQPAEETVDGAQAMLDDHLYQRFGTPDFAIAEHDLTTIATGQIGVTSGPATSRMNAINVTIRGIGGHGAMPQFAKDPVVMAAELILQLQTLISRENDPQQPAVITVGSIRGGTKRNVIADKVELQLTMRSFSDRVSEKLIEGIRQIAAGIAVSNGLDAAHAPIIDVLDESTVVNVNNPELVARLEPALVAASGRQNVMPAPAIMASEDFGVFSLGGKIPSVMLWLGAVDPAKLAASRASGIPLPGLHSPLFAPIPEPTLRAGVTVMTAAALALLAQR
jgi:hippurate hydrolase